MAANTNIDRVYIQTYEQNVRHLAQQMQAKFRGHIIEKSSQAQKHNWETMGFATALPKTAVAPPTPDDEMDWNRRVSLAQTIHTGTVYDNEDVVQMLVDPQSSSAHNLGMAMNRSVDDIIIAAIEGNALDGAGSENALGNDQKVNDGTASGIITFDNIAEVQEKFMASDIDPSMPKCAAIGAAQVRHLLSLTEQTSADFAVNGENRRALQSLNASGVAANWMGFDWILSNRLTAASAGETNCLFWCPDGIGMHTAEDITVQVAQDPSASFAWRIYARMTMGAVRIDDSKVVTLNVLDSAA